MSIISDPPAESVNGKQLTAALALAKLLEHELPAAIWTVHDDGRLSGQIHVPDDTKARASVADWAEFLGATATASDPFTSSYGFTATTVEVTATYRGVSVKVWTHVNVVEEKAQVPA